MNIRIRLRIPGILLSGIIAQSKELHSLTAFSVGSTREANLALSSAGGDNESEKGLEVLGSVFAADLGGGGFAEGGVWEFFLDHDGNLRVDGSPAAS